MFLLNTHNIIIGFRTLIVIRLILGSLTCFWDLQLVSELEFSELIIRFKHFWRCSSGKSSEFIRTSSRSSDLRPTLHQIKDCGRDPSDCGREPFRSSSWSDLRPNCSPEFFSSLRHFVEHPGCNLPRSRITAEILGFAAILWPWFISILLQLQIAAEINQMRPSFNRKSSDLSSFQVRFAAEKGKPAEISQLRPIISKLRPSIDR